MSLGKQLVNHVTPRVLAGKASLALKREAAKGCSPKVYPRPVALEPPFRPSWTQTALEATEAFSDPVHLIQESLKPPVRLDVWISPEQAFDWKRSELFLKLLTETEHPAGLEISGNSAGIRLDILCHADDACLIQMAFMAQFDKNELAPGSANLLPNPADWAGRKLVFMDFYPPPPYSHLLTRPEELIHSPYESVIRALVGLPREVLGAVQVIFQPVSPKNDWHRNVQALLDLEYASALWEGQHLAQRYAQQAPSNELRHMASGVETKAHGDKPFYAAALRVLALGPSQVNTQHAGPLAAFSSVFMHGGRPLGNVPHTEYETLLTSADIANMFNCGLVYRPGFLLNSWELTGLVHVPPASSFEVRQAPLQFLVTLPPSSAVQTPGLDLGVSILAGVEQSVSLPKALYSMHSHVLGASGQGKTTTLENMAIQDIQVGHGIAVIDPHGDLIARLVHFIPEAMANKTIWMDPGDPVWIPLWNPLAPVANQDLHRTADDLVYAFKRVVTGWGDRLEHILRHTFQALLQMPAVSLLDAATLLQVKSDRSKMLRKKLASVLDNPLARQFWEHDLDAYRREDINPAQHKLSKLLVAGSLSLMLSQVNNRIDFSKIMNEGHVLLLDLSRVGSEARDLLGSFVLSLFHQAALSRSVQPPESRRFFRIYCDESQRFTSAPIEDLLVETRKFNVGLVLAHQNMSQFEPDKLSALSNTGSTIIFRVDGQDARNLTKDLLGKVKPDAIVKLGVGEAIARIGTEVVWLRTRPPRPPLLPSFKEAILQNTHNNYCAHVTDVQREIRNHLGLGSALERYAVPGSPAEFTDEDFVYDEFT